MESQQQHTAVLCESMDGSTIA